MRLRPSFWGSWIALILGVGSLVASLTSGETQGSAALAGVVAILGATAYRSAKKTALGMVNRSTLRSALEFLALTIIVCAVALQRDLVDRMYSDPVPNLVLPAWAVLAYVAAKTGTARDQQRLATG